MWVSPHWIDRLSASQGSLFTAVSKINVAELIFFSPAPVIPAEQVGFLSDSRMIN